MTSHCHITAPMLNLAKYEDYFLMFVLETAVSFARCLFCRFDPERCCPRRRFACCERYAKDIATAAGKVYKST